MPSARALGWAPTHRAQRRGGRRPLVLVSFDPGSKEYLTKAEWTAVYAGRTPDLPRDRYLTVVPA